jgi:uncharacterized protein YecE (DUF72 family)
MEFGKVTADELDKLDFTLPADPFENKDVLKQQHHISDFKFYFGSTKWTHPEWVGNWYPKGTKSPQFLEQYAQLFNSIELNATYYRMPTFKQTSDWRSKVNKDFRFCPKFVDQITHIRRLTNTDELVNEFLEGISGFGDNLGPILFMPHPGMGPKSVDTILKFLEALPTEFSVSIELRHKDWFTDVGFKHLCQTLERLNHGTVITDTAGRRDCVHMRLCSTSAMIRFVGNDLHPTDYSRIDQWTERMALWKEMGINTIYFFIHEPDEALVPELSNYLIQQVNTKLDLSLPLPKSPEAPSLFDKID